MGIRTASVYLKSLIGRRVGIYADDSLALLGGMGPVSGQIVSPRMFNTGGWKPLAATDGTDTTPATTETYIAELFMPAGVYSTGIALMNGSAVAGNVFAALADSQGALITGALTGAVAQSGTAAYQRLPWTAPFILKGPQTVYALFQFSSTSARFRSHTVGNFGASKKTGETNGTFTAITVPTTFTTALGAVAGLY